MKRSLYHLGGILLISVYVAILPCAAATEKPQLPEEQQADALARSALSELDCVIGLPKQAESELGRFALGDAHGFLHVFEQRGQSYDEIWVSEYLESPIAGLFLADVNLDDLQELVAYTEDGRIHFLDSASYRTIWSNPPDEYESMSAMILQNVDDDAQVELLFVADRRLHIYDGRDQFEEWRSDQEILPLQKSSSAMSMVMGRMKSCSTMALSLMPVIETWNGNRRNPSANESICSMSMTIPFPK